MIQAPFVRTGEWQCLLIVIGLELFLLITAETRAQQSVADVKVTDAFPLQTELTEGQTPEEVEKLLGDPIDKTAIADNLVYLYPTAKLFFKRNQLENMELIERAEKASQPPEGQHPAVSLDDLREGESPGEVEKACGAPSDKTSIHEYLIYTYPNAKVMFKDQKVIALQLRSQVPQKASAEQRKSAPSPPGEAKGEEHRGPPEQSSVVPEPGTESAFALHAGQTIDEVIGILGPPVEESRAEKILVYTYPTATLFFEDGKLANAQIRPSAEETESPIALRAGQTIEEVEETLGPSVWKNQYGEILVYRFPMATLFFKRGRLVNAQIHPEGSESVYGGPDKGFVIWSGVLRRDSAIEIDGNHSSNGNLYGELPGVPVSVNVNPEDIAIQEVPGPDNDWKRLVLRSKTQRHIVVTINWKTIQ